MSLKYTNTKTIWSHKGCNILNQLFNYLKTILTRDGYHITNALDQNTHKIGMS